MRAIVEGAAKIFEAHRRANADRIRAGIAAGTVAPCDPDALVQLVRAVTDGLMLQRVTEGIALEPVHTLLWENLLAPLERTVTPSHAPTTGVHEAPPNDERPRRSSPPASLSAASPTKRAHRSETTEEPRS
jgi:hypothetical protein